MKKTHKNFPITNEILMPKGSEIVAVLLIDSVPIISALVNPRAKSETRYFKVFGNGWDIDLDEYPLYKHLGTLVSKNGLTVWHVYELKKP